MLIKRIKLENIRSYLNESIEFPQGSVLLSGDIGSGKSTILLAIEFALFGLKRGELSPESILRSGKNTGSVELTLDIEGKEIIIRRVLKRSKDTISQTAGYIIKDGIKKDATAVELRADILDLLGYPKDLITKTKDLIYRYTVYTPQESMKHIIFADKEERLETLRKVFGIDKYKRIIENSQIILKDMREKIRIYQSSISDLDQKRSFIKAREQEILGLASQDYSLITSIDQFNERIKAEKQSLASVEEKVNAYHRLNNEFSIENANLLSKMSERSQLMKDIGSFEKSMKEFEEESSKVSSDYNEESPEKIASLIKGYKQQSNEIDNFLLESRSSMSEALTKKRAASETIRKVTGIDHCPLCLQRVEHSHKDSIRQKEENVIIEADKTMHGLEAKEKQARQDMASIKQILEDLNIKDRNLAVLAQKKKSIESQKIMIEDKKTRLESNRQDIGLINTRKKGISDKIAEMKGIEEQYKDAKRSLDILNESLKGEEIKKARIEKEIQGIKRIIDLTNDEVAIKEKQKQEMARLKDMHAWIEDYFINVMEVIEKHVMVSIHSEFSQYFQSWFSVLIEDDIITARLDDQFTPVIMQNGYETGIENLSGGEKTSIALSYRLSLNKIINDMISTIKTKDILILDEPTDGFSSDQLDKVKDILDQLTNRQIIIVSHETKIESFVQNIIRIRKEEHMSKVLA